MDILSKLRSHFVESPESEEIFNYFDADEDGKLNQIELENLFDAVRQRKEDTGAAILRRIGAVDTDDGKVIPLSLSEFRTIFEAQEPGDEMGMYFAILLGTYKKSRKDPSDLGSVAIHQAQRMLNTYFAQTSTHTVHDTLDGLLRKNPSIVEQKRTIIRFEHFMEAIMALWKAKHGEECKYK